MQTALLFLLFASASLTACQGKGGSTGIGPADAGLASADATAGACAPGATVRAVVGSDGGKLEHCSGASITVPPGSLASDVELAIVQTQPPGQPPFEHALAGPTLRFEPVATTLSGHVAIALPHEHSGGGGYLNPGWWDATGARWLFVEACDTGLSTIEVHTRSLGTFAAIQDTVVFPDNPGGTGTSELVVTPTGEPALERAFSHADNGFATYQDLSDGGKLFDLNGDLLQDDRRHRFHLSFSVDASGAVQGEPVVTLSTYVSAEFRQWQYLPGVHPPPGVALDLSISGNHLTGTFSGSVHPEATLGGSFDVVVDKWRWPPEGLCAITSDR